MWPPLNMRHQDINFQPRNCFKSACHLNTEDYLMNWGSSAPKDTCSLGYRKYCCVHYTGCIKCIFKNTSCCNFLLLYVIFAHVRLLCTILLSTTKLWNSVCQLKIIKTVVFIMIYIACSSSSRVTILMQFMQITQCIHEPLKVWWC